MANMSYCRFQNTLRDLRDCFDHIWDDDLSQEETKARKQLFYVSQDIVNEMEDEESDDE